MGAAGGVKFRFDGLTEKQVNRTIKREMFFRLRFRTEELSGLSEMGLKPGEASSNSLSLRQ